MAEGFGQVCLRLLFGEKRNQSAALPDLPPQASDAEVAAGLTHVEDAQQYVKQARASLYQEIGKIFGRIDEAQAANSSQDGRAQLAGDSKGLINSDGARATVEALF